MKFKYFNKNKKEGEMLFPETLKIIIAAICIGFLIYFFVLLFSIFFPGQTAIQQATANLNRILTEINEFEKQDNQEFRNFIITPSKQYPLLFLSVNQECGGNFCLCLTIKNQLTTPICKPVDSYIHTSSIVRINGFLSPFRAGVLEGQHNVKNYNINTISVDKTIELKLEKVPLNQEFFVLRVFDNELDVDEVHDADARFWQSSIKNVVVLGEQVLVKLNKTEKKVYFSRGGFEKENLNYFLGRGFLTGNFSWEDFSKTKRGLNSKEVEILDKIFSFDGENWLENAEIILSENKAKKILNLIKLSVVE